MVVKTGLTVSLITWYIPSQYPLNLRIKWLPNNWLPNKINKYLNSLYFATIYFLRGALGFFESSILCALSWGETGYAHNTSFLGMQEN